MTTANVPLGIDLSPFRRGINSAKKLISSTFSNNKAISKFQAGLRKAGSTIKRRLGDPLRKVGKTLTSLKGLAVAFAGALAIGKLASFAQEIRDAGRAFNDSALILDNAVQASGRAFDVDSFNSLAKDVSNAVGVSIIDLNKAAADLIGRGFGEEATRQITVLAANASKKTGLSIEKTTRLIADAMNGSVDSAKRLGIEITKTGDKYADQAALGEALLANFSNVGEGLKNPSEELAVTIENIKIQLSEVLLKYVEPLTAKVVNFLRGWAAGDINGQFEWLLQTLGYLWAAVRQIIDVTSQYFILSRNWIAFIVSGAELVIKGWMEVFKNGIPSLVKYVLGMVINGIQSNKLGAKLLDFLGIDSSIGDSLIAESKEGFEALQSNLKTPVKNVLDSFNDFTNQGGKLVKGILSGDIDGITDTVEKKINDIAKRGEETVSKSSQNIQNELQGATGEGLRSQKSIEEQRMQAIKDRENAIDRLNAKLNKSGGVSEGSSVSVKVVSKRSDRFRKARARR